MLAITICRWIYWIPPGLLAKAENMSAKIAYIDGSSGVSGALLLSALCAHGFSVAALQKIFASVGLDGYQIEVKEVYEHGIHGVRVLSVSHSAVGSRPYSEWIALLQRSTLSEQVQERMLACLERLMAAVSIVTGQTQQTLVLDADVIIEMLGFMTGLEHLALEQIFVSPLPLGAGAVQTSPVTLEILRHVSARWQTGPQVDANALVTPVGAAILAACARFETLTLTIEQVGYGFAADRGPLRLCLGQSVQPTPLSESQVGEQLADTDWVTVIESHLDTMTGELLGGLMERLFDAGALDVTYTPIQMKKNRPATLITIIGPLALGEMLALLLLRETSTLGVRIQQMQRLKAQREQVELSTSLGTMLVKVKRLGTQIISAAPEYEECRRVAREHNIPLIDVYEVARHSIQNTII